MKANIDKRRLESLTLLSSKLGVDFKELEGLHQALTHTSYANEGKHAALSHNERLEFLGDAVLDLIVSQYLFVNFPISCNNPAKLTTCSIVSNFTNFPHLSFIDLLL